MKEPNFKGARRECAHVLHKDCLYALGGLCSKYLLLVEVLSVKEIQGNKEWK